MTAGTMTGETGLVVMGASAGGLLALQRVLGQLPETFALPIAFVLHRGCQRQPKELLIHLLQKNSALGIVEARDKAPLSAAKVYVAPAGYHLLVDGNHFALSTEPPVHYARPSIDVLFDSAAYAKVGKLIAILLTGTGRDGVDGLKAVKKRGGRVIVQQPQTAESPELPKAALAEVDADAILSLDEMAGYLRGIEN